MQFKITASLLALATAVLGQSINVVYPVEQTYTVGDAVTIEWILTDVTGDSSVDITLIGGETQGTQVPIETIATSVSALSYTWTIPADISIVAYYGFIVKLTANSAITQYSNPIHIEAADVVSTTSADAASTVPYGTKTVSLSSAAETTTEAADYTEPADYTTVVAVVETTTVPCNTTTVYTPPQSTAPVVVPTYGNATFTTAVVPPTTQGGSEATTTPVTGAAVRFAAGPVAVLGGLLVAAFAL